MVCTGAVAPVPVVKVCKHGKWPAGLVTLRNPNTLVPSSAFCLEVVQIHRIALPLVMQSTHMPYKNSTICTMLRGNWHTVDDRSPSWCAASRCWAARRHSAWRLCAPLARVWQCAA